MPISQEQFSQAVKNLPGMGSDPHSVRARVEAMEKLLERSFTIPGTRIPVGLDSIVGFVPVLPIWSGKPATSACRNGS
jgi:hypothetical protein